MKRVRSIGVFDSGFGGLSVLKALTKRMPQYRYTYLGDTLRAPYGARSADAVLTFSTQAVDFLFERGAEIILFACNTASAEALRAIQQTHLPDRYGGGKRVLGVIVPTLEEVAVRSPEGRIGILATEGTVRSGTFPRELKKLAPKAVLYQQVAPLLVPLVEEGELHSPALNYYLKKYLAPLMAKRIDTLVLGCTHYGHLETAIKRIVGPRVRVVSQAPIVARKMEEYLARHPEIESRLTRGRSEDFFTTDMTERFKRLGKLFYGKEIHPEVVAIE